jgi:hypothetical protein
MPDETPPTDEHGLSQGDYVKAALNWQYNWIGLAGATVFAVVSGSALPLALAAGLELMYVSLVPHNSRFQRLVRSWKYAADKKEHGRRLSAMYEELPVQMRSRYAFVEQVAKDIRANYQRLSAGTQMFAAQMEDKLTGLLHGYIRLLNAAHTHREYLRTIFPEQVRAEIETLEQSLAQETPKIQEINGKRIEILRRRLAKFEKIRENRDVIDAQCAAIEDVLQLIRDQSVTMRDPQEVSAQLDNLVQDVEQTEQAVREVEAIYAMTSSGGEDELRLPPQVTPTETQPPAPRTRVRS